MSDWAAPGTKADTPTTGPLSSLPGTASPQPGASRPWASSVTGATPAETLGPFDHRGPTPLQPMTVGDIIDNAFEVVKRRPRAVLVSHAALVVPLYLLLLVLVSQPAFIGGFIGPFSLPNIDGNFTNRDLLSLPILLVGPVFVTACSGVIMGRLIALWYVGQDVTSTELLRFVLRRLPAISAAFVLNHIAQAIGFTLAGVGALLAMAAFCMTSPILGMEENTGPIAALKRSASLCGMRPGRVAAVLLLGWVVAATLTYTMAPLSVGSVAEGLVGRVFWALSGMLLLTITAPVQGAMMAFLYLDVRIQAEGLDLELKTAEAFGSTPSFTPATVADPSSAGSTSGLGGL